MVKHSNSIALAIDKANKLDGMDLSFAGIELDPEYYEAAKKRISEHQRQLSMF